MTVTVLDSKDQAEAALTGKIPVPESVAADNAAQAAKKEPERAADGKFVAKAPEKAQEAPAAEAKPDDEADDKEGEDGLTPRQKREFTEKMQRSIARKHRQLREAEEYADNQSSQRKQAERRAQELEAELARLRAEAERAVAKDPEAGKPKREDFDSDEKYRDAMDDWRVDQKFKAREAEQAKKDAERRQQELIESARSQIQRAIELVPDYEEVVEAADIPVPPAVAGFMQSSDMFAEIGYYFAQHPDVLEGLHKYSPDKQLVEVGKILSKLQPFSERTSAQSSEKVNGAKPSRETESAKEAAATSDSASPSRTESTGNGAGPSKPRAPVIKPLTSGTVSQVEKDPAEMNTRESINDWQRRNNVNLNVRKRH